MIEIFNEVFMRPIINILVAIYQVLSLIHVPYALGFSIIILTILIRFLLYPFISAQLKSSKKMQTLAPHLSKLKEKHKGDAKRLQHETMRLYKEHGVNPIAGCLPMLIQLPVIWALYSVLQKVVGLNGGNIVSEINKLIYPIDFLKLSSPWDSHFFGMPLGQSPSQLISVIGFLTLLVPIATGFFQFIQSKMLFSPAQKNTDEKPKKEGKKEGDFASAFQTQSMYIFPAMIGFFSYTLPLGLSLYWNTFTIFGILQQYKIQGWGGLSPWIEKFLKQKNNYAKK